jgi:hypothetical protein
MSRSKLISILINEGFSHKTLSTFTSPQLRQLANKLIKEADTSRVEKTTYSKSEVDKMKQDHGGLSVNGTVTPNEDGSVTVTQDIGEEEDIETDKIGNPDVEIDGKDLLRDDEELDEVAVSKSQKRFYCFVKSCKESKYKDCGTGTEIIDAAKSTSMEEINKYCNTSEEGLPEKVSESLEKWVTNLVENDTTSKSISKKEIMEIISKRGYDLNYDSGKIYVKKNTPMKGADLFDSMEQEVAFDRLNKWVLDRKGYELKIDELEKGEDTEESVLLMFLESPTGHVWDIAIFTDGNIYMDNAPLNDLQDFEEEIKEKETRQEGELAETERDNSGEYIGAPVDTQMPTITPVKPGIKSPPKPSRPGPFKKPKTTPKPKATKKDTPEWFNFDEIKSNVEKKK